MCSEPLSTAGPCPGRRYSTSSSDNFSMDALSRFMSPPMSNLPNPPSAKTVSPEINVSPS